MHVELQGEYFHSLDTHDILDKRLLRKMSQICHLSYFRGHILCKPHSSLFTLEYFFYYFTLVFFSTILMQVLNGVGHFIKRVCHLFYNELIFYRSMHCSEHHSAIWAIYTSMCRECRSQRIKAKTLDNLLNLT